VLALTCSDMTDNFCALPFPYVSAVSIKVMPSEMPSRNASSSALSGCRPWPNRASWEAAVAEDWLGEWAMNQMLINVATRKFARSVRLPAGEVPAPAGAGLSKSAASRRFVALSAARMQEWMASDLSGLDLLVIQIDGIHLDEDLILVAALGVDAKGDKHPLGLAEGATENAATVQALIDNLIARGLNPAVPRLFIIDGAKALSKAIRRTFGRAAAIQRCQIHRLATFWSGCPNRCTLQSGVYCDKHGS
jgi:putative transposase